MLSTLNVQTLFESAHPFINCVWHNQLLILVSKVHRFRSARTRQADKTDTNKTSGGNKWSTRGGSVTGDATKVMRSDASSRLVSFASAPLDSDTLVILRRSFEVSGVSEPAQRVQCASFAKARVAPRERQADVKRRRTEIDTGGGTIGAFALARRSHVHVRRHWKGAECYRVLFSSRLREQLVALLALAAERRALSWARRAAFSGSTRSSSLIAMASEGPQVTSEALRAQHSQNSRLDSRGGLEARQRTHTRSHIHNCYTLQRLARRSMFTEAGERKAAHSFTARSSVHSPAVQCQLARNRERQSQHESVNERRPRVHSR